MRVLPLLRHEGAGMGLPISMAPKREGRKRKWRRCRRRGWEQEVGSCLRAAPEAKFPSTSGPCTSPGRVHSSSQGKFSVQRCRWRMWGKSGCDIRHPIHHQGWFSWSSWLGRCPSSFEILINPLEEGAHSQSWKSANGNKFLEEVKCQANRDTLQNPTRVCVSGQKSDRWESVWVSVR